MIPLLKSSIGSLEDLEKLKDFLRREKLQALLDRESLVPKDKALDLLLESREAGTPLLNIGEFLFMTNPEKRMVSPDSCRRYP